MLTRWASILLLVAAIGVGNVVPLGLVTGALTEPDVVAGGDRAGSLREVAVDYAARQVRQSPARKRLARTPLALSDREIRAAVADGLADVEIAALVRDVYRRAVDRVIAGDEHEVDVDVSDVREAVLRGLREALLDKLAALPECSAGDDASAIWTAVEGYVTDDSGESTLEDLPACRPVDPLREEIASRVASRVRDLEASQRVIVFEDGPVPSWLAAVAWAHVHTRGGWLAMWAAIVIALLAGFVLLRRRAGAGVARPLRVALGVAAGAWLAVGGALYSAYPARIAARLAPDPASAEILAPAVDAACDAAAISLWPVVVGLLVALAGSILWTRRR